MIDTTLEEKKLDYPCELTFKTILKNSNENISNLNSIMINNKIDATITQKISSKGKFISYTITAIFPSDEILTKVSSEVASIKTFMNMF